MSLSYRTIAVRVLIGVVLSALALSCKQYEYASPLPGIVEIRLQVQNSPPPAGHSNLIPPSPLNFFQMVLKDLKLVQSGLVKQTIFADLNAIKRIDGGDVYNTLDTMAMADGAHLGLILGQAYVAPETYAGLEMDGVTFAGAITLVRGAFRNPYTGAYQTIIQQIEVTQPQPPEPATPTFFQVPPPDQPANIRINEGRMTRVTLCLNLDSVLVRRTETFELHPYFFITSVQNF